jgi:hypothetical protein
VTEALKAMATGGRFLTNVGTYIQKLQAIHLTEEFYIKDWPSEYIFVY